MIATIDLSRVIGCAVFLLVFESGCATTRLNQFHSFANAGAAYTQATRALTDAAGPASINADSADLITARAQLDPAKRASEVLNRDKLLSERLTLLERISRHATLLQEYFEIIAAMSDAKAPPTLADSAKDPVVALGQLSPAIKSATIGGMGLPDVAAKVVAIGAAHYKLQALNRELNLHKDAIASELAVQEAAFELIGRTLKSDLNAALNARENIDVLDAFRKTGDLPATWAATRADVLVGRHAAGSTDTTASAAQKLKMNFKALVEGNLDGAQIAGLTLDLQGILDMIGKIRQALE